MKLSKIKPNPNNPRLVKDDKFSKLVESLKSFGEKMMPLRPMVIDENNILLGGNMRYKALKELGYKEVPDTWVKQVLDLTEEEKQEFIIKDNVGFGAWDWDALANEWDVESLEAWGLDIPDFEDETILEAEEDDYEEPEQMQVDIVEGDLVEFICKDGRVHRLLCGDSTDSDAVAKLMDGEKADMVFTDPPYNTGMTEKKQGDSTWLSHMFNDSYTDQEWEDFMTGFCSVYDLFTKEDIFIFVCLDWRRSHELVPHLKERWRLSNIIIWDKMVHGLGSDYKYTHEFIHVCKKGKPPLAANKEGDREYQDVWRIQRKMGRDKDHATKKPVELCERSINHTSLKGDVVLDLFQGSGSTMVTAHQLGRTSYGCELTPKYCQVIVDRMMKLDSSIKVKINGKDYEGVVTPF